MLGTVVNLRNRVARLARRPFAATSAQRGMTLLEIIIVVALLATLLGILVRNINKSADDAREDQATIAMGTLAQSLDMFRVHNMRYPNTAEGLNALLVDPGNTKRWRGPYVDNKSKLEDPWGTPFDYTSDGNKFELTSAGKDKQMGTADDIYYPKREGAGGGEGGGGGEAPQGN